MVEPSGTVRTRSGAADQTPGREAEEPVQAGVTPAALDLRPVGQADMMRRREAFAAAL